MSEEIFRKKSLDRVKSPEGLNDYLKVSNPGVWIVIAAAIVLLLGACAWGIFGQIDTTVAVECVAENGNCYCVVATAKIEEGMQVRITDDVTVPVKTVTALEDGRLVCTFTAPIADGVYSAEIVTESIKPISFIFK